MAARRSVFGEQARSVELLWGERPRPRRGPKPGLTVERMVQAAVALADAQGLAAVSMERVAQEFGFTTMSLYRYVPGKSELIDLMIDATLADAPELTGPRDDWRSRMEQWARAISAGLHKHPWVLEATGRLRVMGPNELAWFEAGLGTLAKTPLTNPERDAACLAVLSHVRGMAQFTVRRRPSEQSLTGPQWDAATRELLKDSVRYPELMQILESRAAAPVRTDALEFGLRCMLDGIGRLIAERSTRAPAGRHP